MAQPFEQQYEDVLQNIEAPIVELYRAGPSLVDYEVDSGLGALIAHYTAELQGRPSPGAPSDANRRRVFEEVLEACEWRLGRGPDASAKLNTTEEIVACLKRVRKSAQRWTKRGGRQGYLTFVSRFIP